MLTFKKARTFGLNCSLFVGKLYNGKVPQK